MKKPIKLYFTVNTKHDLAPGIIARLNKRPDCTLLYYTKERIAFERVMSTSINIEV